MLEENVSCVYFFFSSRRRHTRLQGDWSSDVCSSDLVTAIESPVVLQKQSLRIRMMADNLVNTLSKLRISMFRRKKLRTHADVTRIPTLAAILGAINTAGRACDVHAILVRRIRQDGLQTQT